MCACMGLFTEIFQFCVVLGPIVLSASNCVLVCGECRFAALSALCVWGYSTGFLRVVLFRVWALVLEMVLRFCVRGFVLSVCRSSSSAEAFPGMVCMHTPCLTRNIERAEAGDLRRLELNALRTRARTGESTRPTAPDTNKPCHCLPSQ